jgi:DNA polymerase/3'-5' exonuclease PolX
MAKKQPVKSRRVPLAEAEDIAARVCEFVRPYVGFSMVVGSIRRGRPEIADIELVVLPKDLDTFLEDLYKSGFDGGKRIQRTRVDNVKVELYIAHIPEEIGAMVFTYTGDKIFNIAMRSIAKRQGMLLDQYGLWESKNGKKGRILFQSPYEEQFFEALGVDYHGPEERSFMHRSKEEARRRRERRKKRRKGR